MTRVEEILSECCLSLAPPPKQTLSEWAETEFRLSPEYSAHTGELTLYPFQRAMLDAFTDPYTERIVAMTAVQLIKTLLMQCAMAYCIAKDPGPALMVYPTDTDAETFSRERLDPMIRDIPAITGKVEAPKSRSKGNTLLHKTFHGGFVALVGSHAPGNMARRTIRYLFCDEIDKFEASAGVEGNPIALAEERTVKFRSRKKIVLACSPTIEQTSAIYREYLQTDQRQWWVPCHACGAHQVLVWDQVKWDNGDPDTARYECINCGAHWSDVQRWAAVDRGEWQAQKPFRGRAGFWISGLYSYDRTLRSVAAKFLSVRDNPEEHKVFKNTILAETWREATEALDWEVLMSRREEYRRGTVPAGVRFLTAGVDCQKTWLEGYVWGWGDNRQRWVIDHFRVERNPFDEQAWTELEEQLRRMYPCGDGSQMGLTRMCIDTGYASNEVYRFARRFGAATVLAVDGRTAGEIANAPSQVDVTVGGKKITHGCKLWGVNVSKCKSELYGLLARERPADGAEYPAGWVHFPSDMPADFFRQLTAERLVCRIVKGFPKWEWEKDPGSRNEALDCHNYARAGAAVVGWDRNRMPVRRVEIAPRVDTPAVQIPAVPAPVMAQQVAQAPRPAGGGYFGNRGRGWFDR